MSKLDFALQEKNLVHTDKMRRELADIENRFLNQESEESVNKTDIDPEDWLEVFAEDQVRLEGCR